MISPEFLLTSLIVVLVPGTGVIYTVSTGIALRWQASLAAALGCTMGILPHLIASIFGLSAILHSSALAFQVLKFAGSIYLLYLAWSMWHESGSLVLDTATETRSPVQIAFKGVLINILNPKLTLFFFAFLPLFVTPDGASPAQQMMVLSAIFMGLTLVIFALYGILASGVRTYLMNSPKSIRRMQRSFAVLFAALAVQLALSKK
jgi:threonine/homoserine/homoserine lactone efflux protein